MTLRQERYARFVAKLRAIANHEATNIHEAEAAAEQAQRLMTKYSLSETMISADEKTAAMVLGEIRVTWGGSATGRKWRRGLAGAIAYTNDCRCLFSKGTNTVVFVGFETDLRLVEYLFDYLEKEIQRQAELAYEQDPYQYTRRNSYINSFCWGAVSSISERLRAAAHEAKREVQEEDTTGSTALAIRNKDEKLAVLFADRLSGTRKDRQGVRADVRDANGYYRGREVGSTLSLNRPLTD